MVFMNVACVSQESEKSKLSAPVWKQNTLLLNFYF